MSQESNSDSDIEMKTIPLKKGKKKIPTSPTTEMLKEPRKLTTREMVTDALSELKSRKGVSYQAIKKYLVEKYQVDTEKMNLYIKKYLKSAVESGDIIQTKGVGATGSFKLAPVKKQIDKKIGKPEEKVMKMEKADKVNKIKNEEKKSNVKTDKNKIEKESEMKNKTEHKSKKVKLNSESKQEPKTSLKSKKVTEAVNSKSAKKATQTPAKKKMGMMRRKSIGSIIKPPKMKPKAN